MKFGLRIPHRLVSAFVISLSPLLLFLSPSAYADSFCPACSYGPDNSFVCTPADPGYYVPVAGATEQTIAPVGYYVSGEGWPAPIAAGINQYVPDEGATFYLVLFQS
ncbi:hypothetical protein [Glaciecola sp. 1036]|uniref:hypothetical protein n=1 Tax=Alteromonadaceae TaxID=72275 RepID=UPI003D020C5F